MSTNQDFDLKTFQSEVLNDFTGIQMSFSVARADFKDLDNDKELKSHPVMGFFVRAGVSGFGWLAKRTERNVESKPDYSEQDAKATTITNSPKIQKLLCPKLKAEISANLPVEAIRARMVSIITTLLTRSDIADEFSIERNVRLFSLIILKIWQTGIDKYCAKPRR